MSTIETPEILRHGLLSSQWGLTRGGDTKLYFDLDQVLSKPNSVKQVAAEYLTLIEEAQEAYQGEIHSLAFIEKDSGPIGALSLKDLLMVESSLPGSIVRVQRRVTSASIKGYPISSDESVLLISDVATSGAAILEASQIIWEIGARVPVAIVYLDREQGATDILAKRDVVLLSVHQRSDISEAELMDLETASVRLPISSVSSMWTR